MMKKTMLTVILILACSLSAMALPFSWSNYEWDREPQAPRFWSTGEKGELIYIPASNNPPRTDLNNAKMFTGDLKSRDISVKYTLKFMDGVTEIPNFIRYQDANNFYVFVIKSDLDQNNSYVQFIKAVNGKSEEKLKSKYKFNVGVNQAVEITAKGDELTFTIGGNQILDIEDTSIKTGSFGFSCLSKGPVYFSNFQMTAQVEAVKTAEAPKAGTADKKGKVTIPKYTPKTTPAATPSPAVQPSPAAAQAQSAPAPAPAQAQPPVAQPAPAPAPEPAPAPTPQAPPKPKQPELPPPNQRYAVALVDYQIYGNNNKHNDPADSLGPPDAWGGAENYVSLGGGFIILDMGDDFTCIPGIGLKVYEASSAFADTPGEAYQVFLASRPDGPWRNVGLGVGITNFDPTQVGITKARYIKIVDMSPRDDNSESPGCDIDAVETFY
ncbi:MAG: hypothetical protein M1269_06890 [Chloroflexi bacterium]|nr:hypothetical protein [Chloroflexota bacterium]